MGQTIIAKALMVILELPQLYKQNPLEFFLFSPITKTIHWL